MTYFLPSKAPDYYGHFAEKLDGKYSTICDNTVSIFKSYSIFDGIIEFFFLKYVAIITTSSIIAYRDEVFKYM